MATTQLIGKITAIFPAEQKSDKFTIRAFWVEETNEKYPSTWEIQCHNADCSSLDKFSTGNTVQVNAIILGKISRSGDRVYTNLKADGIKLIRK